MDTQRQTEEATPPTRGHRPRDGETGGTGGIVLGPRDLIQGKLVYEGDMRVQGTVEGEAALAGDLSIEGQGTVKAKVEVRNLNVRGSLEGDATVRDRLLIAGSGTLQGNVRVGRLAIEDGAVLNGSISMERRGESGRSSRSSQAG